jgi:CubicO group peptidase (beta-lactamase class C family)
MSFAATTLNKETALKFHEDRMNHFHLVTSCWALLLLPLFLLPMVVVAGELPLVKPAEVGMSSAKLALVDNAVEKLVTEKQLAGAIVMIARRGKVVHWKSYGHQDLEANVAMQNDSVVRIYSMTKAITSTAALILFDEGKLDLDAPVSKYLPNLKKMQVYHESGSRAPNREPTVRDLMRHTSGQTYGYYGDTPVDKQYLAANLLDRKRSLAAMVTKLGELPLLYEPGEGWQYSVSTDVLGRVVEVVSGDTLDTFFPDRIFAPLDMKDTGFTVRADQKSRFAANYNSDGKGSLTLRDGADKSRYLQTPKFLSGGGGLVSTARDYMRFLVMISAGGQLNGQRVLSEKAVQLMTTNQLPKAAGWIRFGDDVRHQVGFGLGFSVRQKTTAWDPDGRIGEYGWGGAASTHYWVSPKDELVVITLEQVMPFSFQTEFAVKGLIYDAITD